MNQTVGVSNPLFELNCTPNIINYQIFLIASLTEKRAE